MMSPTLHSVHQAVNRRLLLFAVERRLLGVVFACFLITLNLSRSFPIAMVVGLGLYLVARQITKREAQIVEVILRTWRQPAHFDVGAGMHDRFDVTVRRLGGRHELD